MSEETPKPARKPRSRRAKPAPVVAGGAPSGAPDGLEPGSPAVSEPAVAQPPGTPELAPEPQPLEVPLEDQITSLPPLEFPGSQNEDFIQWAADKRRRRIRVEIYGGALLVLVGVVASVFTGQSAFIVISLFAVVGLAAYEFLVTSFE